MVERTAEVDGRGDVNCFFQVSTEASNSGKDGRCHRSATMVPLAMSRDVNKAWKMIGRETADRRSRAQGKDWTDESADTTTLFDETSELPPRQVFAFLVVGVALEFGK